MVTPSPTPAPVPPSIDQPRPFAGGHNTLLILFVLAVVAALVAVFLAKPGEASGAGSAPSDLSKVLLPFVAVATAIERFWETVFSWYESAAMNTTRLIGLAADSAGWVALEYRAAQKAVSDTATALASRAPQDSDYGDKYALFQKAESRLLDAQTRIAEGLKAPTYVAVKQAVTLLGSLAIGLGISAGGHLALFRTAGFSMTEQVDYLLTGLLIGAGPGPMHEVIGLLQGLRDSVSGLASLAQGTAIKKATEALQQAENTASGKGGSGAIGSGTTVVVAGPSATAPATAPAAPPDALAPPPPITTLPLQRQAGRLLQGKPF